MGLSARPLEQDAPGRFRHMIHDEVDKWVDKIIDEVFVDGKEPTLMELSQLFCETKREFFGACLEDVIPSREEIAKRSQEVDKAAWQPALVVASDGAHVPTRRKAKRDESEAKGDGRKPRASAYICWARIESCMWPAGIKFKMKNNLVLICHWLHLASPRVIFASAYWEMGPIGCGNT